MTRLNASISLSSEETPWTDLNDPESVAEDRNYRAIRDWVVGSFSERSLHSNTLYRRIPGYSQGVIVQALLMIKRSSLQRLTVDDPRISSGAGLAKYARSLPFAELH